MRMQHTFQISDVAKAAGVSVRTLHYYDEIGLLTPSHRSEAGYRLYTRDDLLRLQQIVVQRELGLTLEDIRRWLDDPAHDRRDALLAQRRRLTERRANVDAMLDALDRALAIFETNHGGNDMTTDIDRLFDGFDHREYDTEAQARWGHTDAYKESVRRTSSYTAPDWDALKTEQAAIYTDARRLLAAGARPDGPEAMDVAERHRLSIDRWFYPCSDEMHRGLASLWETDKRFEASIDRFGAGLTRFLASAVRANAEHHDAHRDQP